MDITNATAGAVLVVLHNFTARSSDELSLFKGDVVELLERDDEFGDGWFSGKHIATGQSGLFPAVYTAVRRDHDATTAPVTVPAPLRKSNSISRGVAKDEMKPFDTVDKGSDSPMGGAGLKQIVEYSPQPSPSPASSLKQTPTSSMTSAVTSIASPALSKDLPAPPNHLNVVRTKSTTSRPPSAASIRDSTVDDLHEAAKSPVMTETLSVIQEHISDMNTTSNNMSKYSRTNQYETSSSHSGSHPSATDSYIAGSETDEEDSPEITEQEVHEWTPSQVALYLSDVGVERAHCQVFEEQDISGEVLLGMEQSSLFIREFELGSVGRRLRTWQKIKAFQDAVKRPMTPRPSHGSGRRSAMGSRAGHRHLSSAAQSAVTLPYSIPEAQRSTPQYAYYDPTASPAPTSSVDFASPPLPSHAEASPRPQTPSQKSIRAVDAGASPVRLSSIDVNKTPIVTNLADGGVSVSPAKQSSKSTYPAVGGSPRIGTSRASFLGHRLSASIDQITGGRTLRDSGYNTAAKDPDRGYFSSTEAEKSRKLRKRDSSSHSRRTSGISHSRVASTESAKSGNGDGFNTLLSSPTLSSGSFDDNKTGRDILHDIYKASPRSPRSPIKEIRKAARRVSDATVNLVTSSDRNGEVTSSQAGQLMSGTRQPKTLTARSVSQAVTAQERVEVGDATPPLLARTDSSPSASKSFESEAPTEQKRDTRLPSASARRKGKKHTSAYMRGLEKKCPLEQIADSDCSGWMKKKNTRLMTTWKPRLFVLRGRRLSYYYSEEDQEERGLIDISGHRVLPANNERLTGLHASLTGVAPVVPPKNADGSPNLEDDMFIFKLVPPRVGMSKAVNFTKPTIHYFAVESLAEGRRWMAALMKATIDRDETGKVITSYALKTISLAKARQMRQRPPALQDSDDEAAPSSTPGSDRVSVRNVTAPVKPSVSLSGGLDGLNGIDIDTTSLEEAISQDRSPEPRATSGPVTLS